MTAEDGDRSDVLAEAILRLLEERSVDSISADSLVRNFNDELDPLVDYTRFSTLHDAVENGLESLVRNDQLEVEEHRDEKVIE